MNGKKVIIKSLAIFFIVAFVTGCSTTLDKLLNNNDGVFGKASKQTSQIDGKLQGIKDEQSNNSSARLDKIGAFSKGGVEYALNQIADTNTTPEVDIARQMNDRVEALANKPDFTEVQGIEAIVNQLLSVNGQTRTNGQIALIAKDKQIAQLQSDVKNLEIQKNIEVSNVVVQANVNAQAADQYKATLTQLDSWGGLGAIWYGVKKLVIRLAWIIGIGSGLFLLLRLLASTNPIASAIFAIFDQIGSCIVNVIDAIFPKAVSLAGNVATTAYNDVKSALTSLVDSVETVKLQSTATGTPATIETLLDTAELSMTPADKAMIESIKLQLGWVKPATVATTVPVTTTVATPMPVTSSVASLPVTASVSVAGSTVAPLLIPIVLVPVTASLQTSGSVAH